MHTRLLSHAKDGWCSWSNGGVLNVDKRFAAAHLEQAPGLALAVVLKKRGIEAEPLLVTLTWRSEPVDWETPTGKSAPVHIELALAAHFGYGKHEEDCYLGLQVRVVDVQVTVPYTTAATAACSRAGHSAHAGRAVAPQHTKTTQWRRLHELKRIYRG